LSKDRWPWMDR